MSAPGIAGTAGVDPLVLSVRASLTRRLAAALLDLLPAIVLVVIAVLAPRGAVPAVAAAVAWLVGCAVRLGRTGRTPGMIAMGLRVIERSTGVPSGRRLLTDLFSGRLASFDVRSGRDPISPALAPFTFPAVPARPVRTRSEGARIRLDTGRQLMLRTRLVIGRSPSVDPSTPAELFAWADVSRTLSKSHGLLEWDGERVWFTDLGSTNGSELLADGATQRMLAFQRTPLPAGAVLGLGDRTLTIEGAS